MGRHPGIQFDYRMKEIAGAITKASLGKESAFQTIRRLEQEAEQKKKEIKQYQKTIDDLLALQTDFLQCQRVSEFGIPVDITKEEFELRTSHEIDT